MNNISVTNARLAGDPVLSTTTGGNQACKFRIASQNKHRDSENNYGTNWYNCTIWGKRGETIAKYFKKGSRINVDGDLIVRDYVDKNGAPRVSVDIEVRDFDFVDSASQSQAVSSAAAPSKRQEPGTAINPEKLVEKQDFVDDDLPF